MDHGSSGEASRRRGRFVLVTGLGHCGTRWISWALTRRRSGRLVHHEYKLRVMRTDWRGGFRHEHELGVDDWYAPYFERVERQLRRYALVGDANSWTMARVPEVDKRLRVDRVIHLVRNGVQNVHALFHFFARRIPRDDWTYTHFLPGYWELAGRPFRDRFAFSDWEAWCFAYTLNSIMPEWMAERLGADRVEVVRLEDLVGDVNAFRALVGRLDAGRPPGERRIRRVQRTDRNRKIHGDNSPETLWRHWTDEQRESFRRLCGPTMERFGYPIPPPP